MRRCGEKKYFIVAALALYASPALALDEIYSPHSEPGELSLEYGGSRTFDHDASKNNDQAHEIALEYGVNNWLTTEISGGFEKAPDSALRLVDGEIETRFQFTEPGQYWLDSGLLLAYGFSTQSREPDSLEAKLLLEKDTGKWTHTANVGFEQSVGQYSDKTGGPDYVFLWNTRYRYNEYFQPGIEIQSDIGTKGVRNRFSDQEHYIGPAVYGTLLGNLKYQAAWLAGATNASADSAARILLEYEMHF